MAVNEYRPFFKAPGVKRDHQIQFSVVSKTLVGVVILPSSKDTDGIFYSFSQLGLIFRLDHKKQITLGQY